MVNFGTRTMVLKKIMIKTQTGIVYTPKEFKKLNQCVNCGKANKNDYAKKCDECKILDLKKCDICEIVLRTGLTTYYTYDTFTTHRDSDVGFKASKNLVREFTYQDYPYSEKHSENLCVGCKDWKTDMKDKCAGCGSKFDNFKDYYKRNGNMCRICVFY